MNKILSINTIKNVFAALGAKTSDDNYGVALLDKTTAEPKGLMEMSDLASVLGSQFKRERNVFIKNSVNEAAVTHTVPGKPIFFLIGLEISTSDNLTPESVQKENLSVPISLSDFWCSVSGNTISFNFTGYEGSTYGAIKFDVLYI